MRNDMPSHFPVNKNLIKNSQLLRCNTTKEENHLWYDFLRGYPIQFNRQKIIGNYIVDFFCKKAMLVIELDGSQHYDPDTVEYDKQRTAYLESLNIRVVRFTNIDIYKTFENVCQYIDQIVRSRL